MAGEPLLVLQENFRWMNYEYDLCTPCAGSRRHTADHSSARRTHNRLSAIESRTACVTVRVDPRSRAHVPVCRIIRQWTFFDITDHYVVQHFNQFVTGAVECHGSWPAQFSLTANGVLVARVEKQFFSWTDTYRVRISPHTDCLLFLGIACAIDRIHHEVQDEHRRREASRHRHHHHHRDRR